MSARLHSIAEPKKYEPGLVGDYPGQESYMELGAAKVRKVRMVFCWCPPTPKDQPFMMGSPADEAGREDDETHHPVVLTQGFWLAKHPVTQQQWLAVMPGKNPSNKGKGDLFPVDTVSWKAATEFCDQAGMKLPTEAQWEYACRAGTTTPFGIGSGAALNAQLANFNGGYPYGTGPNAFKWIDRSRTLEAGAMPPNAWGLHDMHGQLWEWCEDFKGNLPSTLEIDPSHTDAGRLRVLRGGSWILLGWDARSASRVSNGPEYADSSLGFRPCPSSTSPSAGGKTRARSAKE